jgi:hypothetical protein
MAPAQVIIGNIEMLVPQFEFLGSGQFTNSLFDFGAKDNYLLDDDTCLNNHRIEQREPSIL